MIPENSVYLAVLVNFIGGFIYLKDTLVGKAKPNKVTWFLWALAPLIAFVAEIKEGVGLISLMTFSVGFYPLLIFIASFFNRKSEWKLGLFDLICGALSILGLVLWFITKEGSVAILFALLADGLAALPTIKKSFSYPDTESASAFIGGTIGGGLTLLTLKNFDLAHLGFPLYIFVVNAIIALLIQFKLGKKLRSLLS